MQQAEEILSDQNFTLEHAITAQRGDSSYINTLF
jgi:hypothetical protein